MASNTHSLSKRGRLFAWLGLSVEHLTISRALRAQALWRRNSTLARVYVNQVIAIFTEPRCAEEPERGCRDAASGTVSAAACFFKAPLVPSRTKAEARAR